MRTTVILPADLLTEAKRFAAETHRPLTRLIEDSLREALARRDSIKASPEPFYLPTSGHGGVFPGVDLSNNADLLDRMESYDGDHS